MSHSSRPRARGPAQRRRHVHQIEAVQSLEERQLLAPVLYTGVNPTVTFTAATTPTNADLGTVNITTPINTAATTPTAAPVTSVALLTPEASFGNDIVRIAAGPGGVFGSGVYAISRGAGGNTNAVNRPGVIYRVDPATGKATVFFDLNTVLNQLEPGGTAAASAGAATGLVNWYDIAFDPEGYFDGKPSMFVSSVDTSDPNKNIIYRIAPDGTFMGAFVAESSGASAQKFNINPTSIVIPPPEDQSFLRGLIAGSGGNASVVPGSTTTGVPGTTVVTTATTTTTSEVAPGEFAALFFDANNYSPGQVISNASALPAGVSQTALTLGPQVGLTASNPDYESRIYSAFTDFGSPAGGGIPAAPGFSGVQGLDGSLLIGVPTTTTTTTNGLTNLVAANPTDQLPLALSSYRRFEDIAFDQYGYFSNAFTTTTTTGTSTNGFPGTIGPAQYAGSLFVADLSTGLATRVTSIAIPGGPPATTITIPVQGPGPVGVTTDSNGNVIPITSNGNTTDGGNLGGRILRITPQGVVTIFATGFDTSGDQGPTSFIDSAFSISFSADGTTLYAADNEGIWQFKTVTDLASATSGSIVGLNDLRTLGVPYDGLGSAVAVIDTGVDANTPNFRGRVAAGTNVITNGAGNDDTSPGFTNNAAATAPAAGQNQNTTTSIGPDGHGTLIAGVVAQFVPQATIDPVNIFYPFLASTGGTTTTATSTSGTGTTGTPLTAPSTNAVTTNQAIYQGLAYVAKHPFVNDPIRPNTVDRVIATTIGFGSTATFSSEGAAYRLFPQIVISFKNQLLKLRKLGIAPIAAAGQFGAPFAAGSSSSTTTGTGSTTTTTTPVAAGNNNNDNANVGDNNGMALPAILNEVVSVTGSIPFPFATGPNTPPTNPPIGVVPRPLGPALIFGSTNTGVTIGGTPSTTTGSSGGSGSSGNRGGTVTAATGGNNLGVLTAGNFAIYADRILAAANRSITTDYAAPALDIPTFRRTFILTTAGQATGTTATDPTDHMTFTQGGTSLSSAIVTGSFALVSSALNYWANLNKTGVTADAYLTQPVGALTLNYGVNGLKDLSAFNNPDGINAILQWTSIPISDPNDGLSASTPLYQYGSTNSRNYSEISVSNAVAAIEGTIAIQYLLQHNIFPIIDTNHDGLITAQEVQNFADDSNAMGLPEAGAMARLLGGTARIPANSSTEFGDTPDQPDVLQRRFNFFDYAVHGQLKGAVSITEFSMLAQTLLPLPNAFVINNRAKASANGYLLDPNAVRDYHDLQHILPSYEWVPRKVLTKYRNFSPAAFKVNRGQAPSANQQPAYTLFDQVSYSGVSNAVNTTSTSPATTTTTTTTPTTDPTSSGVTATSTTPAASTTSSTTTDGSTTSTSSQTPASTTNQDLTTALVAALNALANPGGTSSTTSGSTAALGTLAPTGTLTPLPTTSGTTTTAAAATTTSTGTTATATPTTTTATGAATDPTASTTAAATTTTTTPAVATTRTPTASATTATTTTDPSQDPSTTATPTATTSASVAVPTIAAQSVPTVVTAPGAVTLGTEAAVIAQNGTPSSQNTTPPPVASTTVATKTAAPAKKATGFFQNLWNSLKKAF
jgi:hypothetical protein